MDNKCNNLKIHFIYVVLILLLVIIFLITGKFGNNEKLVNYISFAATISSIFLAVISIIYAFYSNFSQSNVLSKIDVASETLNTASKDVKQSTEILSSELQKLQDIVKDIPDSIESMSSKIDNLLTNDTLFGRNNPSQTEEIKKIQNQEFLYSFYRNYSIIGLIGLYIACLCTETGKEFDLNKANIDEFNPNKYVGMKNYYYLYGCFITLSSLLYLINIEQNDKNDFIFKVTFLHHTIKKEDIRNILEKTLDIKQQELIKQIDKYFNS